MPSISTVKSKLTKACNILKAVLQRRKDYLAVAADSGADEASRECYFRGSHVDDTVLF